MFRCSGTLHVGRFMQVEMFGSSVCREIHACMDVQELHMLACLPPEGSRPDLRGVDDRLRGAVAAADGALDGRWQTGVNPIAGQE